MFSIGGNPVRHPTSTGLSGGPFPFLLGKRNKKRSRGGKGGREVFGKRGKERGEEKSERGVGGLKASAFWEFS